MSKVILCGWVCPDCCTNYGWEEDRDLPVDHLQQCENCNSYWSSEGLINDNSVKVKK